MKRFVLCAVAAFATVSSTAAEARYQIPRLQNWMSYTTVRNTLVKAGWKPAPEMAPQEYARTKARQACEQIRHDMCNARQPEVAACSGTGRAICDTYWSKGATAIVVETVGDVPPSFFAARCVSGCR